MTLYLDAIWLLNLLIDYMILRLTGYLTKKKNSGWRIFLAAVFASSIVFVVVFYPQSMILYPLGKIIFSLVIIVIAFKYSQWVEIIKTWLFFYFVSFVLGGALIGLHFIFDQSIHVDHTSVMTVSTGLGTPVSWVFVCVFFPISWYFTKQTMDKQALINYQSDQLYLIKIEMLGKSIATQGYLDSANHLTDPITKYPVIIIDQHILSQFFDQEELSKLEEMSQTFDLSKIDPSIAQMTRLIPYQDVTNPSGLLLALKPDSFHIHHQEKVLQSKNILVGLRFSLLSPDQEYHCLLNPQVFKHLSFQD